MFNWFKPKIYNSGYLPEKDGHKVYFMEAGNPKGEPVLIFHGGPGGSAKIKHTYSFDRKKYRMILFDQRGGGKSLPAGEIKNNTTQKLLEDAERLLDYLNIKGEVIVKGGSWGATLALLFAIKNPKRVKKLFVSQIFLADKAGVDWLENQSGLFYPDMLERLKNESKGSQSLAKTFAEMINSDNLVNQVKAVSLYGRYEWVLGKLNPSMEFGEITADDIASSRVYINYAAKDFMLEDGYIMNNIAKIQHIPTLIVHNRLDFVCPVQGAYDLHKAMPKSKLVIVPDIGHGSDLLQKTIIQETKAFL